MTANSGFETEHVKIAVSQGENRLYGSIFRRMSGFKAQYSEECQDLRLNIQKNVRI